MFDHLQAKPIEPIEPIKPPRTNQTFIFLMKRFIGFVKKEFFHIFRDRRTLLILFGMPIAQILLFGYAVTNEIKEAKIAIFDPSGDEITEAITQRLISTSYYRLGAYLDNMEEADELLKGNHVKQVIMFEPDFGEKFQRNEPVTIRIISDATDPNTANTLQNYSQAIILSYQQEKQAEQAAILGMPTIEVESRMRYNPELKGVFLFVPGLITIILMLVSAMMTSISIAREKELGTMELLLASPMKPIQIIMGKVTPYIFPLYHQYCCYSDFRILCIWGADRRELAFAFLRESLIYYCSALFGDYDFNCC